MADQNLILRRIISSRAAIAGERLKLMIRSFEPASSRSQNLPRVCVRENEREREREGNKMMVSALQNSVHVSNF